MYGGRIYAYQIIFMSIYFCMTLITPFLFVLSAKYPDRDYLGEKRFFWFSLRVFSLILQYELGNRAGYSVSGRKQGDSPVGRLLLLWLCCDPPLIRCYHPPSGRSFSPSYLPREYLHSYFHRYTSSANRVILNPTGWQGKWAVTTFEFLVHF